MLMPIHNQGSMDLAKEEANIISQSTLHQQDLKIQEESVVALIKILVIADIFMGMAMAMASHR